MGIDYSKDILEYLSSPASWVIAEILAFILFSYCLADIIKKNDKKTRLFRVFELFGFVVYAGIFENIGVLVNTYNYSLDRLVMVGVVPLSLLMFEAAIFYAALQFAELMKYPKWVIPIVVAFLGMLQDMTIDPAAVFDLHLVNGVLEGRWNWTSHYEDMFFGIPFFNYIGWYLLMFYYTSFVLIGRNLHEKSEYKDYVGFAYVIIIPIICVLLIVSPLTRFILFLYPIFPMFVHRTVEICMLSLVSIISLSTIIYYRKRDVIVDYKKNPVIWVIPVILHLFDIILAFTLGIEIAYIPVLLFAGIHLGYLAIYILKKDSKIIEDPKIEE